MKWKLKPAESENGFVFANVCACTENSSRRRRNRKEKEEKKEQGHFKICGKYGGNDIRLYVYMVREAIQQFKCEISLFYDAENSLLIMLAIWIKIGIRISMFV